MYSCPRCNIEFSGSRGLMVHCNFDHRCGDAVKNQLLIAVKEDTNKVANESATESIYIPNNFDNDVSFDFSNFDDKTEELPDSDQRIYLANEDSSLIAQYNEYCSSGKGKLFVPPNKYKSSIDLLDILHKSGSPLYLFDHIMQWAKKSTYAHHYDFSNIPERENFVNNLINQFDFNLLEPMSRQITLPGSKATIEIILHDFLASFYTLLCDEELMHISNLLLDEDNIYKPPEKPTSNSQIDDINTGEVWHSAYSKYVKIKNKDILCPIIFFIDKTHTDNNGRLCIEQVRFTLGIFKRSVRNQSRAWRSIGYIMDQAHIPNLSRDPTAKMKDYQYMTDIILESYRKAQLNSIAWELKVHDKIKNVSFMIPTLFIIGDTDGHDQMVGKFKMRNSNVKRLCRYCDCPFDETDNPYFDYAFNKADYIAKKIKEGKVEDLRLMSMHCVRNAWTDVYFCDTQRGIFGATPAEAMHCLQQGLYQYILTQLFEQKKLMKKRKTKDLNKLKRKKKLLLKMMK
jgi:hypothetical protein